MSKDTITINKDYLAEACDLVGNALNEVAEKTIGDRGMDRIVKIVTRDYKALLLKAIFEEGEEKNG